MKEWFKEWFSSAEYLKVYFHRNEKDALNLLDTILGTINIPTDSHILDAACGAGRHSIILAEKGYNVTAFDLSKTLLDIGEFELKENNFNVDFVRGDLRTICLKANFNLVLSLFTSFGYFEEDTENFRFPEKSYSMLKDGGYFVLDYLNSNFLIKNLIPETVKNIDGHEIIERRYLKDKRVNKEITIYGPEEQNSYLESVKLYTREEIVENFRNIGFRPVNYFGDYLGSEFNVDSSERLIIIFRK